MPNSSLDRRRLARHAMLALLLAVVTTACGGSANAGPRADRRGASSEIVRLPADRHAAAVEAALRTSFDLDNSSLVLLLDPTELPAGGGYVGEEEVPAELAAALLRAGTIRGRCAPSRRAAGRAPFCPMATPGYAVRISDVFRAEGDTLRLYVTAERVQPAADSSFAKAFAFEGRYLIVPRGDGWTVVRAARKMIT
jgi:hypothetical protein